MRMTTDDAPKFRRRLRGCLCLVGLVVLGSCGSGGPTAPRRLNLLLVTIDTLRADRLACYGYSKIETPNLDQLARKGVLFENAVTPTTMTRCPSPIRAKLPESMPNGGRQRWSIGRSHGSARSRANRSSSGCTFSIHTLLTIPLLPFGKNTGDVFTMAR